MSVTEQQPGTTGSHLGKLQWPLLMAPHELGAVIVVGEEGPLVGAPTPDEVNGRAVVI